jgi:hypothetical protein
MLFVSDRSGNRPKRLRLRFLDSRQPYAVIVTYMHVVFAVGWVGLRGGSESYLLGKKKS